MNYLTFGNKNNKALLFIHGMASSALLCYGNILKYLNDYYVVLVEVDGHSDNVDKDFTSIEKCCNDIEKYVEENLNGHIFGLCGFSMGAVIAIELIGRGNIIVDKVVLDAPITIKMGIMARPFTLCFVKGIKMIQDGKNIPKFLFNRIMGKDNTSVIDMLYKNITSTTIKRVCNFIYKYEIPKNLKNYNNTVLFLRGSKEKYPKKTAKILRKHLPQLQEKVFNNSAHGEYLHKHPLEYTNELLNFFKII